MPNLSQQGDRLQPSEALFKADGISGGAAWCEHQSHSYQAVPGFVPRRGDRGHDALFQPHSFQEPGASIYEGHAQSPFFLTKPQRGYEPGVAGTQDDNVIRTELAWSRVLIKRILSRSLCEAGARGSSFRDERQGLLWTWLDLNC
jgi:hypothetical protein